MFPSRAVIRPRLRSVAVTAVLTAATITGTTAGAVAVVAVAQHSAPDTGSEVVLDWYDVTADTVTAAALPTELGRKVASYDLHQLGL